MAEAVAGGPGIFMCDIAAGPAPIQSALAAAGAKRTAKSAKSVRTSLIGRRA
jgi:hypothetical protein